MKYYVKANTHTHSAFVYSRFAGKNLPVDTPLEGKTCRGTLLDQYDMNLSPDGISVV
jgi:hypothetical protein